MRYLVLTIVSKLDAPPVAGLIRWFPRRKGFASGLAIMGFGAGALLASPLIHTLMNLHFKFPKSLGACQNQAVVRDGKHFLEIDGVERPVVIMLGDMKSLGFSSESTSLIWNPGDCFLVGTGSTGAPQTILVLGVIYLVVLLISGYCFRPAPAYDILQDMDHVEEIKVTEEKFSSSYLPSKTFVRSVDAFKTFQFYCVWISLFLNATAGIALLGVAKNLISDVFKQVGRVDEGFCTTYVAVLSLFNGLGRIFWAAVSDKIGRKSTFSLFFCSGILIYLSIPYFSRNADLSLSLPGFIFVTVLAITIYGGGFAISPAYLSDLFGTREVGSIYSRLLTAWSAAGLCGPTLLAYLRRKSEVDSIIHLSELVTDLNSFKSRFGVESNEIKILIDRNAIDISTLVDFLRSKQPATEVNDPTSTLYDTTMYFMSGLLLIGFLNNLLMKPVPSEKWTKEIDDPV